MSNSSIESNHASRDHWWYSLVTASPTPEDGEIVNVGVLLGNGQTSHLAYKSQLPRLACIAEAELVESLESVLSSVRDRVMRGMDVESLRGILGPQLQIAQPRQLFHQPTDQMVRRLVERFLPAQSNKHRSDLRQVIEKANARLDDELPKSLGKGIEIVSNVRPRDLYSFAAAQGSKTTIPRLARALRSQHKDVLVDSVAVERGLTEKSLRAATMRINRAFWAYNQMRGRIEDEGRELRLVGILHPSRETTEVSRDIRAYIKHVWSNDADVIDGDEVDVDKALDGQVAWLNAV